MASYFQSYFQASSMSKRLLQFAISRLEIIDTDALDLEHLDIAWGKNSVFEFKNVGLKLKKLEKILQLPSFLEFSNANIVLLRLVIPVDIYSSPIFIEVEGLEFQLQIKENENLSHVSSDYGQEKSHTKAPNISEQGGSSPEFSENRNYNDKDLPSTTNLAQSFLEIESENEKSKLEAALLSETQEIENSSILSDDGETDTGIGNSLALPEFISRFLQGIIDRLQIKIHDIDIILSIHIPSEGPNIPSNFETDVVSVQLMIQQIKVRGVGQNLECDDTGVEQLETVNCIGERIISFYQIRGYLISEANVFSVIASSSSTFQYSTTDIDSSNNTFKKADEVAPSDQKQTEFTSCTPSVSLPSKNLSDNHTVHYPITVEDNKCFQDELDNGSVSAEPANKYDFFNQFEESSFDNSDSSNHVLTHNNIGDVQSVYMSAILHEDYDTENGVKPNKKTPKAISVKSEFPETFSNAEIGAQHFVSPNDLEYQDPIMNNHQHTDRPEMEYLSPSSLVSESQKTPLIHTDLESNSETYAIGRNESSQQRKKIFELDSIRIHIPNTWPENSPSRVESKNADSVQINLLSDEVELPYSDLPGAFSAYLPDQGSRSHPKQRISSLETNQPKACYDNIHSGIKLTLGNLMIEFDISIGKLILKLMYLLRGKYKLETPINYSYVKDSELTKSIFMLNVGKISVMFLDRVDSLLSSTSSLSDQLPSSSEILLQANLIGFELNTSISGKQTKTSLSLKKFLFGYKDESIFSFDSNYKLGNSVRDLKVSAGVDISAYITQTPDTCRFEISTLPIKISVNLQKLDETFSWFGGLSSVLNLGSSIVSNATMVANSPNKTKTCGVKFETPVLTGDTSISTQSKSDIRIGGCLIDLVGSECCLKLVTSAVKIVSRDNGIGLSIQKIRLSGPHLYQPNNIPAITVDIISTRVEILPSPKDSDLDRLLSLISPSKSKFSHDDDILLDTLLRQRDKGAVLRLTTDKFKIRVLKINELSYLPELGQEVSKLATVAKYLPDDNRPGLLSLILIRNLDFELVSGHSLGNIEFFLEDLEAAQITLPALLAFSINSILISRNKNENLVESAYGQDLEETTYNGPVIIARIIGNEMEPVIKTKLWNLKFEYRLPTLMALLDFLVTINSQGSSDNISASVITPTGLSMREDSIKFPLNTQINAPTTSNKPIAIDVILQNCTLGLNPVGLPSKMLLGMTEAHLKAALSKDEDINASIELKKTSILLIDDVANLAREDRATKKCPNSDGGISQVTRLCSLGYVSVGYISSVKVTFKVKLIDGYRTVDVEVCDDLFVLESCADSTQTLVAIMSGLVPTPPPPSKDTKYRTKVVPMHDLFASLSADAFGTAEGDYNFDHDFGLIDDIETEFPTVELEEGDDFDFDSQYYEDKAESAYDQAGPFNLITKETQDGLLLENLLEPNELENYAELNLQENYFEASSILEGDIHAWNSAKNTYERPNSSGLLNTPLKVRLRDVHVTWNLFDGYDWQNTRDTIIKAVQDMASKVIETRARNSSLTSLKQELDDEDEDEDEASVIEDFLFNSIYIGVPSNRDPRDLSSVINQEINDITTDTDSIATSNFISSTKSGGTRKHRTGRLLLNRSKNHKITFDLRGVCVDFIAFSPDSGETQSSVDIRVHDLEVFDHVPTSTWRKFATYMQDAGEREMGSSMIHIEILNVKPVAELVASEIVLKATVLPLRLHVDQDALDFITRFFEFKDDSVPGQASSGEAAFIQRVEVNSIKIKLDFKPKRVDYAGLRSGHTTEFMNFLILDGADIELRHTIIYGISGFEKLGRCLNDIWMPDVKRNQLPGILAGLAPVRPFVNVGVGFRHLMIVPMREYKKDGRVIRSISKGAAVFAKTTGTELVKLGAKVAVGVQTILQGAEGFFGSPDDTHTIGERGKSNRESKQVSLYANQPIGVLQGLKGGYNGLQRDLVLARDAIIAVSGEAMESGTAVGAFKAVGRYAPTVILRPAIGVAKAGGQILMGATNSLDPVNLKRAEAKYKK